MSATAVLVGALLVGDSVRGSLRELTLDRLGRIDELLITDRFFRESLARETANRPGFERDYAMAAPLIVLPQGVVEHRRGTHTTRSSDVLVIGADPRFWSFDLHGGSAGPAAGDGEIELNEPLASDLGVRVGDRVTLRFAKSDQVPADSPLAKKDDRVRSLAQLRVSRIRPAQGLGRFSLTASQRTPACAFLSLSFLQQALDQRSRVNCVIVAGSNPRRPPDVASSRRLNESLAPTLEDYGLHVERVRSQFPAEGKEATTIYDYFHLTTDRLIFEEATEASVRRAFGERAQAVLTYLANDIARVSEGEGEADGGIPYSTVAAVDSRPGLGPLVTSGGEPLGPLSEDEIVLNSWAAQDQKASVGDTIRLSWFAPETTHGQAVEKHRSFKMKAITPLTAPRRPFGRRGGRLVPPVYDQPPTLANDPHLTPEVEGITDQDTIENWDPPFPFDYDRVRSTDDEYWKQHRTTPKAFVSLKAGQAMWGSRFGDVTSFRLAAPAGLAADGPPAEAHRAELESAWRQALEEEKTALGFTFRPVKRDGLAASAGATPFDVLFLFLSAFVIVSALLLTAVLFRLGVERRAAELGVLLAIGVPRRRVTRLYVAEGALVAAAAGVPGVVAGIGYAAAITALLRDPNWWMGAVGSPFLTLHVGMGSLVIGYLLGVAISAATIWASIRQARRAPASRLLAGVVQESGPLNRPAGRKAAIAAAALLAAAAALAAAATRWGGEAQAGAFVGSGALLLAGLLLLVWRALRRSLGGSLAQPSRLALARLAARSAARNPSRSTLTIGLMAAACFLIISMSAFRLSPSADGAGGFDLMGESSQPVFADLNSAQGREEALGASAGALKDVKVLSLRVKAGDDASCNNLYQASQPRVWGVTRGFVEHFDKSPVRFAFAQSDAQSDSERENPWRLLFSSRKAGEPTPVVIDKNTAMYSLHLYRGIGEEFEIAYEGAPPVRFRVVGLLANSVLQGGLLVGEDDFLRLFPEVSGYRLFLFATAATNDSRSSGEGRFGAKPTPQQLRVTEVLEDRLGDQGLDVRRSYDVLQELLAVQNTYLSTFQSLGALGLVLGCFGLAAVQLRAVLERRGELALLRATGFRRRRLAWLVMLENGVLLLAGLCVGLLAASAATAPHALAAGAGLPGLDLVMMLLAVLVVGLLAGLLAVRAAVKAPLLEALRGK